jgi:hypothetical protein
MIVVTLYCYRCAQARPHVEARGNSGPCYFWVCLTCGDRHGSHVR